MNLKNLNGWQRLGILLSAIWLVVVVFGIVTLDILPATRALGNQLEADKAEAADAWAQATIEEASEPDPSIRSFPDIEATRSEYSDLDDVTFVEQYQKSYPDVNFGPVNAKYEQLLDELNIKHPQDRQWAVLRISGYAFLVWIVPLAFVFFLGRAVVWVWQGFKSKGESNDE